MVVYPIITVPPDAAGRSEPMGSKRKFWYDANRVLFKYSRPAHGEDWAEKIVAEVAESLGLPHASVELAECGGECGTISERFAEERDLVHGNELLGAVVPGYPMYGPNFRLREHTVETVIEVLAQHAVGIPTGGAIPAGMEDGADVFVGYLMLDALVGNTDRHHENWAIVRGTHVSERSDELAPTFDHASSLGRELSDEERSVRLRGEDQNRTVNRYLARGASRFYARSTDRRPLSPMAAFHEVRRIRPLASRAWIDKLSDVGDDQFADLVGRVPENRMSGAARLFAKSVLHLNRRTLLSDGAR